MHTTVQSFVECAADEYDYEVEVHELSEGTKTAADAAAAVDCDLAQIVKAMVMSVDGELVVCLTSGVNEVDVSKLAAHFGAAEDAVDTADPDDIKDVLGWSIGGVPPFCHETDVPVLLDETLAEQETVWAGAGTPNAMFPVDPELLQEYGGAERADVFRSG